MTMTPEELKQREDELRAAVQKELDRLLKQKWWKSMHPFTVKITIEKKL